MDTLTGQSTLGPQSQAPFTVEVIRPFGSRVQVRNSYCVKEGKSHICTDTRVKAYLERGVSGQESFWRGILQEMSASGEEYFWRGVLLERTALALRDPIKQEGNSANSRASMAVKD